jgi:hypothetical protein
MKYLIGIIIACQITVSAGTLSLGSTPVAIVDLNTSLTEYWKCDESTTADAVGAIAGIHLIGSGSATRVAGKIGNALAATAGKYWSAADTTTMSLANGSPGTSYTIAFWAKINTTAATLPLFGKTGTGNGVTDEYVFNFHTGQQKFLMNQGGGGSFGQAINEWPASFGAIVTAQWYFICGTYNGTRLQLYVLKDANVATVNTGSYTFANTQDTTDAVYVGLLGTAGTGSDCAIDEIHFYKGRVLTLAEIQALKAKGEAGLQWPY